MNRRLRHLLTVCALSLNLMLTGCWDRIESENRLFVMVVGVDKYESEKTETKEDEKDRVRMTYLLPKFSAVQDYEEGVDSRQLRTSVGSTAYEATRKLSKRDDSQPFFQHMKAAIVSVDIAREKDDFLETLDGLERQDEISRKLHILIAENPASEILQVESLLKPLSYKLQGMSSGNIGSNYFIPKTLEEVITSVSQGATLIPKIRSSKTEISVAGSAIIKKEEFIGWLGEEDTKSVAFLTDVVKQDIMQVEHKGTAIPYIIKGVKTDKSASVEDGRININILLTVRGDIQQYKVNEYPRLTDRKLLKDIEKLIQKDMTQDLNHTINKLQNEINADVLDIDIYLRGHYPDIWEQVEKDWDVVFPKVKVNVRVDPYIEKIGSIK